MGGRSALQVSDSPVALNVPKKLLRGISAVGVQVVQPQPCEE